MWYVGNTEGVTVVSVGMKGSKKLELLFSSSRWRNEYSLLISVGSKERREVEGGWLRIGSGNNMKVIFTYIV